MIPHKPFIQTQEFPKIWNAVALVLFILMLFVLPGIDSGTYLTQSIPAVAVFIGVWAWIYFTYLKLIISDTGIKLLSSPIGIVSFEVRKESIAKVEVVQVDAFKDFGGWGWRLNRDNISGYIFGGKTGLLITKTSGDKIMISTTSSPDELSSALATHGLS